eukprot:TRINITY_DN1287_c0_g2_i1.p1 TRINITY_DN1287_c0_g2~~TRINITY_DN1287_c0_g2_i1.p1  ORF type:complete len:431 (+),score=72.37 TRINITY_DN1287_c0_g2_i1:581-1873(+)
MIEVVKDISLFLALFISSLILVASYLGRRKTHIAWPFFIKHWILYMVLGLIGSELCIPLLLFNLIINAALWFLGGYSYLTGQITLVFSILSSVGLIASIVQSLSNRTLVLDFAKNFDTKPFDSPIVPPVAPAILSSKLIKLDAPSHYPKVTLKKDIRYGPVKEQLLDVLYIEESNPKNQKRPVFLFVHGGAWSHFGNTKENTSAPLLYHMASKGWIVFTIEYRMAPYHQMPAHIDDVRTSIDWVKENANKYQGDSSFITICGNSAGGHLSSLAALTSFETGKNGARTAKVNCCVDLYGVHDFVDRHNHWVIGFRKIRDTIMAKSYEQSPDIYHAASPIDFLQQEQNEHKLLGVHVPFLVIHGDYDEVVPLEESIYFAEQYKKVVKGHKLFFLELPGAHHAFDLMYSIRTLAVLYLIESYCYSQYKAFVKK